MNSDVMASFQTGYFIAWLIHVGFNGLSMGWLVIVLVKLQYLGFGFDILALDLVTMGCVLVVGLMSGIKDDGLISVSLEDVKGVILGRGFPSWRVLSNTICLVELSVQFEEWQEGIPVWLGLDVWLGDG